MTVFPAQLDTDLQLPLTENGVTEITSGSLNNLRSAILSIEKTLGINLQGNEADLETRIGSVIDADGNIIAAALSGIGLVTLPIDDAMISSIAAIQESKLSLNFSTAALNAAISSVMANLTTTNTFLTTLSGNFNQHTLGAGLRHDGYMIDLDVSIGADTNVESSLHNIHNSLTTHETATTNTVHPASAISVVDSFPDFDATNVQEALEGLDGSRLAKIETHQRNQHLNSIEYNTAETGQANLSTTTCATTIYQTNISQAANILLVMPPNVARITTIGLDLRAILIGQTTLTVQANGAGLGVSYPALTIDLTSVIGTQNLDDVVKLINTSVANAHYPVAAYNTLGQLTIAHNIAGSGYTIAIIAAPSGLGFDGIMGVTIDWSGYSNAAYVDGCRIENIATTLSFSYVPNNTNLISPNLGNIAYLGNVLCNITNHSNVGYNGTYYICSYPTTSTFILSSVIPVSTTPITITMPANSLSFPPNSQGKLYDIFLTPAATDGYGLVTPSLRVSYDAIPYVVLKTVSKNFSTANTSWAFNSNNTLTIYEGALSGTQTPIQVGFVGSTEVLAPDNISSAVFEVYGFPTYIQKSMVVASFLESASYLYLSSVHYAGNLGPQTLAYVTDKRLIGGTIDNITADALVPTTANDALNNLRNNGVMFGFDVISSVSSSFLVRGGKALVSGIVYDVPTQTINVPAADLAATNTWLLAVDNTGALVIEDESIPGFAWADLTEGDSYGDNQNIAPIVEFDTTAGAITTFTDRRFIIAKLDKTVYDLGVEIAGISGGGSYVNMATLPLTVTVGTPKTIALKYDATLQLSGSDLSVNTTSPAFTSAISAAIGSTYVPYVGAANDLILTPYDISAGGIVCQPLKMALDGYQTQIGLIDAACDSYGSILPIYTALDGYVPYTGATADLILGAHALTTTHTITATPSVAGSNAITGTGNTTGAGGYFTGGAGGVGVLGFAGSGSGSNGIQAGGDGAGSGLYATGGLSSGNGVWGNGGSPNGIGVLGYGAGGGPGGYFGGDVTGNGIDAYAGDTNGYGIVATGSGAGYGGYFSGGIGAIYANGDVLVTGTISSPGSGGALSEHFGAMSYATQSGALALGYGATADDTNALSVGTDSSASGGSWCTAIGTTAIASNTYAVALGASTNAAGEGAISIGYEAESNGNNSLAIGYQATTDGYTNALAIGAGATATGNNEGEIGTSANPISLKLYSNLTVDGYVYAQKNVIVTGQIVNASDGYNNLGDGYDAYVSFDTGNAQVVNLGGALGITATIHLSNYLQSGTYVIKVIQHPTTPQTVSWSPIPKWPGGTGPTISTGGLAVDLISLFYDGNNLYGSYVQNMS